MKFCIFFVTVFVFYYVRCLHITDETTEKVLNSLAKEVSYVIIDCKKEVNFSVRVIQEFLRFFDPLYRLREPELGCVVTCLCLKMNLLYLSGELRTVALRDLMKKHGANTKLSDKIALMFEDCHSMVGSGQEFCTQGLMLARCLREKAFQERWAPDVFAHIEF